MLLQERRGGSPLVPQGGRESSLGNGSGAPSLPVTLMEGTSKKASLEPVTNSSYLCPHGL